MGLVGTIPPQMGNLSFLLRLDLSNNSFHGTLPEEMARLRRLKYVSVAYNGFAGKVPMWLETVRSLNKSSFRIIASQEFQKRLGNCRSLRC
ncbi:receptor like protein 29-like [Impatiens glandulifera]|uniref:receptor like protein 29-like n=1 Tax=Impatiens glandulifera TaxID=253017 RepID=UPI001FB11D01|nr:receptor like protein 29-like [Impatiens glandulifera]